MSHGTTPRAAAAERVTDAASAGLPPVPAVVPPVVAAADAVEDRLFKAVAVLRIVVLVNCVVVDVLRRHSFAHPWAGVVVVGVIVGWTGVALWAYAARRRRGAALLVVDLAVTLAVLGSTVLVKGPDFTSTVPGFWVMGALLAWGVRWGTYGGLAAGAVIAVVDIVPRSHISSSNYGNGFLLVIGGPIIGYAAASIKQLAAERDVAQRAAAAAAERARLARVVHDGVLQVLALVQRRGGELGGPAAELGRLAGEQEVALRTLIRAQDAVPGPGAGTGSGADGGLATTRDLAGSLGRLALRPGVDVVLPGGPVELAGDLVAELTAVVAACLDNVERHVGAGARAWVLLEALPDRVEVAVRDEGPGIAEGRLAAAAAEGRLGVAESIRGRIRDLGGTARLTTGAEGTEWEFTVPLVAGPGGR